MTYIYVYFGKCLNMLRIFTLAVISFYITFASFPKAYAAIIPLSTSIDALSTYPSHPNEILPIQPILIYPKSRQLLYESRNLDKDDDIIYVKLLKRKSYRPYKKHPYDEDTAPSKELTMKDIFYVKALANGQFSQRRLKVYRLPEFFAINVYHKGQGIQRSA